MKPDDRPRILLRAAAATAALLVFSASASAQRVAPPPLPPGSEMIRIMPGQSPVETQRAVRAHKHGHLQKKDQAGASQPAAQDTGKSGPAGSADDAK